MLPPSGSIRKMRIVLSCALCSVAHCAQLLIVLSCCPSSFKNKTLPLLRVPPKLIFYDQFTVDLESICIKASDGFHVVSF